MDVKTTPKVKTSPAPGDKKQPIDNPDFKPIFIAAAVSMSWQLAIAVIVPIVGGYYLDQQFHTSPLWEITGFIVAGVGFYAVLRHQLSDLDSTGKKHKRQVK